MTSHTFSSCKISDCKLCWSLSVCFKPASKRPNRMWCVRAMTSSVNFTCQPHCPILIFVNGPVPCLASEWTLLLELNEVSIAPNVLLKQKIVQHTHVELPTCRPTRETRNTSPGRLFYSMRSAKTTRSQIFCTLITHQTCTVSSQLAFLPDEFILSLRSQVISAEIC